MPFFCCVEALADSGTLQPVSAHSNAHTYHDTVRMGVYYDLDGEEVPSPVQDEIDSTLGVQDLNLFVQGDVEPISGLRLTAGIRYGYFAADSPANAVTESTAKNLWNPRLAAVWQIQPGYAIKALYGRAFRLPSIVSLYSVAPLGGQQGDPNMAPEMIDTVELVLDVLPLEHLSIRNNYFANLAQDEQIWEMSKDPIITLLNRKQRLLVYGVELNVRWLPTAWLDLYASGGFQEGWYEGAPGEFAHYLSDIARVTANASATFRAAANRFEVTPWMQYIGRRADLGGAVLWHATTYWHFNNRFSVGLIGRNLFDRRYATLELMRNRLPNGIESNQPLTLQLSLEAHL